MNARFQLAVVSEAGERVSLLGTVFQASKR